MYGHAHQRVNSHFVKTLKNLSFSRDIKEGLP